MTEILTRIIRQNPPQTQQEACLLAARQSIAAYGVSPDHHVRAAALGLARGLFAEAFASASAEQRRTWIDMCEHAYREAAGPDAQQARSAIAQLQGVGK